MFWPKKSIFAGKQELRSQPFCPYISTSSGYSSLGRSQGSKAARTYLPPMPRRGRGLKLR